jgi:hypothetical protein
MASIAGATAGGIVMGGITGAANGKGSPYAVLVTSTVTGLGAGGAQLFANSFGPVGGESSATTISSILSTVLTDASPNAIAVNGLTTYFLSKAIGRNPGPGTMVAGKTATYITAGTIMNRGLRGGSAVVGPMSGIAGALTDETVQAGWNMYCGN